MTQSVQRPAQNPQPSRRLTQSVLVPFEGDRILELILSKALLLAQDDKIKDATIVQQIRRT